MGMYLISNCRIVALLSGSIVTAAKLRRSIFPTRRTCVVVVRNSVHYCCCAPVFRIIFVQDIKLSLCIVLLFLFDEGVNGSNYSLMILLQKVSGKYIVLYTTVCYENLVALILTVMGLCLNFIS